MSFAYIVIALILVFIVYKYFQGRNLPSVSVKEAKEILKAKSALFLDVRTPGEWNEGHVSGALHIPLQELSGRISELDKHKNRDIIVYCRSGNRSSSASQILLKQGFKVKNMTGGFMSW